MTGPYTVVTLIASPGMDVSEALTVARELARQTVDVGLGDFTQVTEQPLS